MSERRTWKSWPDEWIRLIANECSASCSGEDLVAEATVGDAADHFFGVHGIGEAEVDGAGFVEGLHLVGREGDVSAGDVVLELGEFAGADDGDDGDWAIAEPSQGDLGHAFADLFRD